MPLKGLPENWHDRKNGIGMDKITDREHWGSRLGFILAAAGSAIGLGTMWKFPYTVGQNGGGAFILLFLLFNFLVGIPLFVAELVMGRKGQRGVVGCFELKERPHASWPMAGWLAIFAVILIFSWYVVIAGWSLNYILMSLSDAFKGLSQAQIGEAFDTFRSSPDLNILWQGLFLAANIGIVLSGLSKGIEYWSKLMTSALFIMLLALSLYATQLSGYGEAIRYILMPDFSKLNASSVLTALALALFTLSLGFGIMITYGSYMKPSDDIPKTAVIIGLTNLLASVLIAMMIFPMIFTYGFAPQEGEGLIFKTMPYVFEQMPGSMVLSVVFFSLLLVAALTSSVAMLEAAAANFMDLNSWSRKKAVLVSAVIGFLLGLPSAMSGGSQLFANWQTIFGANFLTTSIALSDWLVSGASFLTALFVGYAIDKKVCQEAYCTGSSWGWTFHAWRFLMRYIVPTSILLVILQRARIIRLETLLAYFS